VSRRALWVLLVLTGQIGLAIGFVALGQVLTFKMAATTALGWRPGSPNPNWVTTTHSYGWPLPWAQVARTTNEVQQIDRSEWAVTNYALPATAGLLTLTLPLAVGNWLLGAWGRRATDSYSGGRRDRCLWVAVAAAVGGFVAAGCEAVAARHINELELVKLVSVPQAAVDAYWKVARPVQAWRRGLSVPQTDRVYALVTAGGAVIGSLAGLLLFRPWRRAGGPSASDGAAATTPPPV
jgi:hypothetical protein